MSSVADLKAKFDKPSTPPSGAKVAELKAKLNLSGGSTRSAGDKPKPKPVLSKKPSSSTAAAAVAEKLASRPTTPKEATTPKEVAAPKTSPKPSPTAAKEAEPKFFPPEKEAPQEEPAAAIPAEPEPVAAPVVEEVQEEPAAPLKLETAEPMVGGVPPPRAVSPSSRWLSGDVIPPSVEDQDWWVLWALSFVVPFFMLRFVFELVRKFVLAPARLAVRFAPGGSKLMGWLYVKLGPIMVRLGLSLKDKLPPMDSVNGALRAGLDKLFATMQTAGGAAWPHLVHFAESVKTMRFREAAVEIYQVLRAWAPMLLLLGPFTKNAFFATKEAFLIFWRISKNAFYLPFGRFLRGAVQNFGKALSENPDAAADQIAGLLGPIFFSFFSFLAVVYVGLTIGIVDDSVLSTFYMGWFFRMLGMVAEPVVADPKVAQQAAAQVVQAVLEEDMAESIASAVVTPEASTGGWLW